MFLALKIHNIIFNKTIFVFLFLFGTCNASVDIARCIVDWPVSDMRFSSELQYDDPESKINPTVNVLINGKPAKMILDTGANLNVLWDTSLLNENPAEATEKLYGHIGSGDASVIQATLADSHGNAIEQNFHLITESVLSLDGYAGALSPQTIADDGIMIIDFERNCFFASRPFDVNPTEYDVLSGPTIKNNYKHMVINVGLDNHDIPLLINTGSDETSVSTALVANKPIGRESYRHIDAFGVQIPEEQYLRVVDLVIYGRRFPELSVVSTAKVGEQEGIVDGDKKGILHYGQIGMDVLKDYILYHDDNGGEFRLIKRHTP